MKNFAEELKQVHDDYHKKAYMYSIRHFLDSRDDINNHSFVSHQLRLFLVHAELAANDGQHQKEFVFNHHQFHAISNVSGSDLLCIRDYILQQGFTLVDNEFDIFKIIVSRDENGLIYSKSARAIVQWATPLN